MEIHTFYCICISNDKYKTFFSILPCSIYKVHYMDNLEKYSLMDTVLEKYSLMDTVLENKITLIL